MLGALVLCAAAPAHAGWQTLHLPETPSEVLEVWAPNVFSLGWSIPGQNGASLFTSATTTPAFRVTGSESAGTSYAFGPCFLSVDRLGRRFSVNASGAQGCGGVPWESLIEPSIGQGDQEDVPRIKRGTQGGVAALSARANGSGFRVFMTPGELDDTTRTSVVRHILDVDGVFPVVGLPFGVTRIEDKVHAFIGALTTGTGHWVDSSSRYQKWNLSTLNAAVQAVELFHASGWTYPHVVLGAGRYFLQGSDDRSGTPIAVVQTLDPSDRIQGLSLNVDAGSAVGSGFGMALVRRPTASPPWTVMGARPALSQADAGKDWVERTGLPAPLRAASDLRVACVGARFCVVTANRATSNNVFLYSNDAPPVPSVSAPAAAQADLTGVVVDEGSTVPLTFKATDADGDPLRVTFKPSLSLPTGWSEQSISQSAEEFKHELRGGAICKTVSAGAFTLEATDGLAAHAVSRVIPLTVRHTRDPEVAVRLPNGTDVSAGGDLGTLLDGAPLTLHEDGDQTPLGCQLTRQDWSVEGTEGPLLTRTGHDITLTHVCSDKERSTQVKLRLEDEGGRTSERTFRVHQPGWKRVSEARPQVSLRPDPADATQLRVEVDSELTCAKERQLRAALSLQPDTGDAIALGTVDLPSTFPLARSRFCGRFQLKARLADTGGEQIEAVRAVELAGPGVALDALPDTPLVAECGQRASLTLTPTFPAGACQTPDVSWSVLDGPAATVTQEQPYGPAVLLTEATDLDSRVGQTVRLKVAASMGGQRVSGPHDVRITTRPFVEVRRRTELPAASETGLVGVTVELSNTTACGVTRVRHVEHLNGLSYVAGSAKFDGKPPERVSWNEQTGALEVEELALPGQHTGTLTYVARPLLLGERILTGESTLRGERISVSAEAEGTPDPDARCGCGSTSPGSLLLALVTLAGVTGRRRRQA